MTIYLTTDTHFFHNAMIDFTGRPGDFNEQIFNHFKELTSKDILIHLGDVTLHSDIKAHEMYIESLPCKKYLIRGNHDHKSNTWYLGHGWDFVCEQFRDWYFGVLVLFSHVPISYDNIFMMNIHGHFHNTPLPMHEPELEARRTLKHHLLLDLESNNYKLFNLEKLINTWKSFSSKIKGI